MLEIPYWWWLVPGSALAALACAYVFHRQIIAASAGDARMQEIASWVREGALAFLRQQYKVVAVVFVALMLLLLWQAFGLRQQHGLVPFAFLTSGVLSALSGLIGMNTATRASSRTAQAMKQSLNSGLQVAFRGGAVMGLVVVGLSLLDISLWFWLLAWLLPRLIEGFAMPLEQITVVMLAFGMGASTQALFARVGGGIFTKSADVGADLVGKVEAGIPEDDPRNPAVIADNVGDNVGDVAGMGADLYESFYSSLLAAAALGAAAAVALNIQDPNVRLQFVVAPMVLAGIGTLLSILGVYMVRAREEATQSNLLWSLRRGVWGTNAIMLAAALLVCYAVFPEALWLGMFGAIAAGLLAGVMIGWFTEYYTSNDYPPTQWIAGECRTGAATAIIAGMAQGMLGIWGPLTAVAVGMLAAFGFAGGFEQAELGMYGVGLAAIGMLATLGITLATDACGPIADNAGGNAEMTAQPHWVRERTDALDAMGNTTAATGKGFAIGSAALTALALFAALVVMIRTGVEREGTHFVERWSNPRIQVGEIVPFDVQQRKFVQRTEEVDPQTGYYPTFIRVEGGVLHVLENGVARPAIDSEIIAYHQGRPEVVQRAVPLVRVHQATIGDFINFYDIHPLNPRMLAGMFLGSLMVFIFCGLTMKAVGRAAGKMVEEVRRQFHELGLLTDPEARADYATCVSIATGYAQREMVVPGLLAVLVPLTVGLLLNFAGLMGLLAGALVSGFAVAVFMAGAGGAWDNAKKHIETGEFGGKGSEAHKAAVIGDTVGDPLKDSSGPSLNILIKLMSMVAVVFAGLFVQYAPVIGRFLGIES